MKIDETILTAQQLYTGRIFNVERLEVITPAGERAVREVVRHKGACAIVALDEAGRFLLVEQYRAAIASSTLEIPAGKLEGDEDPLVCAKRELEEETGYRGGSWQKLTALLSTPGFCDEVLHIYLATGLEGGEAKPDADEFLNLHRISQQEAVEAIVCGRITDAKSVAGLLLAVKLLEKA